MSAFGDFFKGRFFGTAFDLSNLVSMAGQLGGFVNTFLGAAGGEKPEETQAKLSGIMGIFGLRDERFTAIKLPELHKRLGEKKYRRLMRLLMKETEKAHELSQKVGKNGAGIIEWYHFNRLRTFFAGMPDSAGSKTGSEKTTVNLGKKSGDVRSTTVRTEDIKSPGSKPSLDALEGLSSELERHWKASAHIGDEDARFDAAYELTEDYCKLIGLPRIPDPDNVPDLKGFFVWLGTHLEDGWEWLKERSEEFDGELASTISTIAHEVDKELAAFDQHMDDYINAPGPFEHVLMGFISIGHITLRGLRFSWRKLRNLCFMVWYRDLSHWSN